MKITINGREVRVEIYSTLTLAQSAASMAVKSLWVMLGDSGKFWVATPADCARLERAGYDFA